MTKEQKTKYIEDPTVCPYCSSNNLMSEEVKNNFNLLHNYIICYDCKERWTEVYKLIDIKQVILKPRLG